MSLNSEPDKSILADVVAMYGINSILAITKDGKMYVINKAYTTNGEFDKTLVDQGEDVPILLSMNILEKYPSLKNINELTVSSDGKNSVISVEGSNKFLYCGQIPNNPYVNTLTSATHNLVGVDTIFLSEDAVLYAKKIGTSFNNLNVYDLDRGDFSTEIDNTIYTDVKSITNNKNMIFFIHQGVLHVINKTSGLVCVETYSYPNKDFTLTNFTVDASSTKRIMIQDNSYLITQDTYNKFKSAPIKQGIISRSSSPHERVLAMSLKNTSTQSHVLKNDSVRTLVWYNNHFEVNRRQGDIISYRLDNGSIYSKETSLLYQGELVNYIKYKENVSAILIDQYSDITYLTRDGDIITLSKYSRTGGYVKLDNITYRLDQPGVWSDGNGFYAIKKDNTVWKYNASSLVKESIIVSKYRKMGNVMFIIDSEGRLVVVESRNYGISYYNNNGNKWVDFDSNNNPIDVNGKTIYNLDPTKVKVVNNSFVVDIKTGELRYYSSLSTTTYVVVDKNSIYSIIDYKKGAYVELNSTTKELSSFIGSAGDVVYYYGTRAYTDDVETLEWRSQYIKGVSGLSMKSFLIEDGTMYISGEFDKEVLSEYTEDTIDKPIELSFTEMHPRSQGLERDVKDIHSVFVNGEKLVKNALVNVYKKPLTVMESPSNNPALGVVIDSQTDEFSFTAGKYLATTYTKPTNWEDIFNDSISKMKSYVMEINAKFNVRATKKFTYVSPSGIPTVVPANTVKTVMVKNVTRDMLTQKAFNLGQIGTVPDATNQITVSKPMFDIVLLLNRDGWTTFTPQHIYTDTHAKGKLNVVHISKEKGAMELEYPAFDKNDKLDTVEVYYKSNPKLTPVDNTDEMVILSESEHILVTDIGDVEFIKQGNNPYKNPLAQFDYNFSDLLGVIGYDGLTFSGDSVKTNVDSLVKVQNNVLVGGSQQSVVKSYNTPVAAIQRSLVYYKETVCLMITIVKSVDGVIDTQNGDITRYITPVEGNLHIPAPPSVKRRTIQQK